MMDNFSEMSITLESMHVMFRQRANCFYPGWAYAMPTTLLRIPYSFIMALLLSAIIYWVVGYDSNPGRYAAFASTLAGAITLLRIPYSFIMAFLLSAISGLDMEYDSNPGRYAAAEAEGIDM